MKIAVTGGTGFIGQYIVNYLVDQGHTLRCWYRSEPLPLSKKRAPSVEWIHGELRSGDSAQRLVDGCDALVHAAYWREGKGFRGVEGDLVTFCDRNVLGSLELFEAARESGLERVVYVSSCSVHEKIRDDRPLDELHPTWALTHYGAHKAAIEQFVHSFGMGMEYPICAVRPTGVYGLKQNRPESKWYDLVRAIVRGEGVQCSRGGKEVHAHDVARAIEVLLLADPKRIAGEAFNCYDQYVSEMDVAKLAQKISGANAPILGKQTAPKHQIETDKIRSLGMTFGGDNLLTLTIQELVTAVHNEK